MKIVLLQDVKTLGKKGQIVTVADGYARNFILPKKLGVEASEGSLNTLRQQQAAADRLQAQQLADAQALAEKINEAKVILKARVGKEGKLFGAVSSKEIAEALEAQCGIAADKKKIVLAEPIRTVGETKVKVKLHKDVSAELAVEIRPE
ncbi:MAG: 50S ribosomal protein L9 [Lachnospiraceae bacterium]|nr:50S ribosomal protein L9 [Lachnospiraceae bacterium]